MASNFKVRDEKCGCSGLRSCLICESYRSDPFLSAQTALVEDDGDSRTFTFCAECGTKAWLNLPHHSSHTAADETRCIIIRGIDLFEEVISPEEEADIVAKMDASDWVNSQSGRRKQDYGPRVNFKKKKLNSGSFKGLPCLCERRVGADAAGSKSVVQFHADRTVQLGVRPVARIIDRSPFRRLLGLGGSGWLH